MRRVHIINHPLSTIVTLVIITVHSSKFSEGPWHLQLLLVGFTNVGIVLQRVLSILLDMAVCISLWVKETVLRCSVTPVPWHQLMCPVSLAGLMNVRPHL
jgi:hypothetical protein